MIPVLFMNAHLLPLFLVYSISTAPGLADGLNGRIEETQTKPFELQAAHSVREETLAWEKWHKRLCKEIMHRTEDGAITLAKLGKIRISSPAFKYVSMEMLITVTKDRKITGELLRSAENPKLTHAMEEAVASLNGSDLLTFPLNSEREAISITFTYERGPRILPGTKWIKNDFETVTVDKDQNQ